MRKFAILIAFTFGVVGAASAQLERKLATVSEEVENTFHAPRHINLMTVEPLEAKTLHFAIMHTFGTIDGGIQELFGLDNGANIMFSFEYAWNRKFSIGAARQSRDRIYSLYGRYHLLTQKTDNSMPVSVSFMGNVGVNSSPYDFLIEGPPSFQQRTSYAGQLMVARKFSDKLSVQVSPMLAYFHDPLPVFAIEGDQELYVAVGLSALYKISKVASLTFQYIPNLNNDLRNNLGVGIDLEAGGHVFQMYFVTSQLLNEQYLLAGGNGVPGEQFRIGFNVNRVFAKGLNKK